MTPRTFFVVLYVDGSYFGLYTAIDHIDDEFARDMGLTGDGNMYKAVDHNANFYRESVYGGTKATLHDGYEKKEGLPENDFSDLDDLVAFSADSDDDTFRAEAPEWIRVDEFVDWFLLVLYTSAYDSAGRTATSTTTRPAPTSSSVHAVGHERRARAGLADVPLGRVGEHVVLDDHERDLPHLLTQPDSAAEVGRTGGPPAERGPLELGSVQAHARRAAGIAR
jgi:hypothetical protein